MKNGYLAFEEITTTLSQIKEIYLFNALYNTKYMNTKKLWYNYKFI